MTLRVDLSVWKPEIGSANMIISGREDRGDPEEAQQMEPYPSHFFTKSMLVSRVAMVVLLIT